jgi:uncharacterized membrane protein YdjX (TVP38/TMEM64 family)
MMQKAPGKDGRETKRIPDSRLPGVEVSTNNEADSKAEDGIGFSAWSLWPIVFLATIIIMVTICCIWYGPQIVMRKILLHALPERPDAAHVALVWLAIAGFLVLGTEGPIVHFLMALPSLLIGFWGGVLIAATAEWCGKLLCFLIGRSFAQRPIRQLLWSTQSTRIIRMLSVLEDKDDQSLYLLMLWQFLPTGPLRTYGLAVLDVPLSKLVITVIPHCIVASVLLSTIGISFQETVHSLRDGKNIEWTNSWQNIVLLAMVLCAFGLFTWIASCAYQRKVDMEAERALLRSPEEGIADSTQYGTNSASFEASQNFGY